MGLYNRCGSGALAYGVIQAKQKVGAGCCLETVKVMSVHNFEKGVNWALWRQVGLKGVRRRGDRLSQPDR